MYHQCGLIFVTGKLSLGVVVYPGDVQGRDSRIWGSLMWSFGLPSHPRAHSSRCQADADAVMPPAAVLFPSPYPPHPLIAGGTARYFCTVRCTDVLLRRKCYAYHYSVVHSINNTAAWSV